MIPRRMQRSVVLRPLMGLVLSFALSVAPSAAGAQDRRGGEERAEPSEKKEAGAKPGRKARGRKRGKKEKMFDFTGLQLDATMRMPQLLYFLDRANQELKRASLEKRSFIPEMVRSVQEEEL